MSKPVGVLFAIVALLAIFSIYLSVQGEGAQRVPIPGPAPDQVAEPSAPEEMDPVQTNAPQASADREALASSVPEEPEPLPRVVPTIETPSTTTIRGRVLDHKGQPLVDVDVGLIEFRGQVHATSDGAGRFEAQIGGVTTLQIVDEDYAALRECQVDPDLPDLDYILIAAPAVNLSGEVRDGAGKALASVTVQYDAPYDILNSFPFPLDRTRGIRGRRTVSYGERGVYSLERVPAVEGAVLRAEKSGYARVRLPVPAYSSDAMHFRLELNANTTDGITGVVLQFDGSPAPKAQVRFGNSMGYTDESGSFQLSMPGWFEETTPLAAGLKDHRPAVIEAFGAIVRATQPAAMPLQTLILGPEALTLSGRVEDWEGNPLEGWTVRLSDGTVVSNGNIPPDMAEDMDGSPDQVETDENGCFELGGLLARDYRLRAWDSVSLLSIDSEPIPAGQRDVVLRLEADSIYERVEGIVVSLKGLPVPGARVSLSYRTFELSYGFSSIGRGHTLADEQGRFELKNVPRRAILFAVSGDMVVPETFRIEEQHDPTQLRLEVAQRCHMRFKLLGTLPKGSYITIQNEAGDNLPIFTFQSGGSSSSTTLQLQDSEMLVRSVAEDARSVQISVGYGPDLKLLKVLDLHPDPENLVEVIID